MADNPFMRLNDKWQLAYDSRQWVIQRLEGRDKQGREKWRGDGFVGSNVDDLYWSIARRKIELSDETVAELARLPATFGEFLELVGLDRPEDDMRSKRYMRNRKRQAPQAPPKAPHSAISIREAAE